MLTFAPSAIGVPLGIMSGMVGVGFSTRWSAAALFVGTILTPVSRTLGQDITGQQVRQAIDRAVDFLKGEQLADGRWPENYQEGGITSLAALALLNADVPANDPSLRRAIEAVSIVPNRYVYTTALKIQVLAAADPVRYRREIAAAAEFLIAAQQANGMWGYGLGMGHTDFSNSQFALLGLHEAGKAGAQIPGMAWRLADKAWINSQRPDGGWGYQPNQPPRGSMTAAGVASLYITGHALTGRQRPQTGADGRIICCTQSVETKPIIRGIAWLAANFSVRDNPGVGSWYYYYMYALERVGILAGQRFIGTHDWYREGAARLVAIQRADGSWHEVHPLVDTSFALLFLAKGHRALLFHKLQWSRDGRWNLTRNDLDHLTSFIADRLGEPTTWEVVTLDDNLERWLGAPILYFNGHEFPTLTEQHTEKLREFVKQGGTLLAVASCTGEKFRAGFTKWVKTAFPDYDLRQLPADHPVFHTLFKVDAVQSELHGIDVGCRTSIFYAPHDLACLWEFPNVAPSRPGLELGANLAAYATGLEPLPDRLDAVRLARPAPDQDQNTAPRGALVIAQLMHNGDWRPDPQVVPKLAEYLHANMGVDVVRKVEPLKATDPKLAEHPVVFMTGHFSFELPPEEVAAVREHVRRGGFLLAEACCGRKAFDSSFRKLAKQLFPDAPLQPLPPEHPIIAGSPGVPLPRVTYRQALLAEQPTLNTVQLEGIELDGRTAIVYSPYGLGCGVDGHQCYACRGLVSEDALKLAGNIVLYALSY